MRHLTLHRRSPQSDIGLPDAAFVYETAIYNLVNSHENEAASFLARCRLEVVATNGVFPLREQLYPVRLVLTGPSDVISELEQSTEIRGRVRQALDGALGPTVYLAQMAVFTCPSTSALAA